MMKASLEKRFGDSCIIDLTSKAEDSWVKFIPFYAHGNIPIAFSDQMGRSVEGIWQGLKVFESAKIDPSKFEKTDMKGLKRTVRRFGKCLIHQKGLESNELLDYKTAGEKIYLPMYKSILKNHLQDLVEEIREIAKNQSIVLLDYKTIDWEDLSKPLSHTNLVRLYILNEYPNPKKMATVIYPTDKIKKVESIFLAGTIDMGNSIDWQQQVIDSLKDEDVIIYNPRRKDWDNSWKENINDHQFNHQVNWELDCLEKSDLVLMYFAPNSKSPISLLETGLFKDKLLVCCPEGFYKKGNIDIVCKRNNILQINNLEQSISYIKEQLKVTI